MKLFEFHLSYGLCRRFGLLKRKVYGKLKNCLVYVTNISKFAKIKKSFSIKSNAIDALIQFIAKFYLANS